MKKLTKWALPVVCATFLAACGGGDEEGTTLKIGASNVPHAEILEEAKPILKEKGINLEITTFQDYVLPNKALNDKEIDANYFQHIPYLNDQEKTNDYDFANAGGVHIEPIGLYSQKHTSLNAIPNGGTVIMSNSVADQGRILSLLQREGLIKLDGAVDPVVATVKDIVENPKNLKFQTDVDAGLLPQIYKNKEGDLVAINTNYAIDAGLTPTKDALALEDENSPYVNIVTVRNGDQSKEDIKTLVEVLQSEEIQSFIEEEYKGAVVPAPSKGE